MLMYKKGDLIAAAKNKEVNIIAHQCNCFNVMGAGIALSIANNFPTAKEVDLNSPLGDIRKLGTYTLGYETGLDLMVYNLYGQYHYGHGTLLTDYVALETALNEMYLSINYVFDIDNPTRNKKRPNVPNIGMPKIGCGLAGGDWNIVEGIINKTIAKHFDVTIYEL